MGLLPTSGVPGPSRKGGHYRPSQLMTPGLYGVSGPTVGAVRDTPQKMGPALRRHHVTVAQPGTGAISLQLDPSPTSAWVEVWLSRGSCDLQ